VYTQKICDNYDYNHHANDVENHLISPVVIFFNLGRCAAPRLKPNRKSKSLRSGEVPPTSELLPPTTVTEIAAAAEQQEQDKDNQQKFHNVLRSIDFRAATMHVGVEW